jgi:hypothetical protein
VWNGDHVVSAGQPEWAAEDAAQHALNLANWRIKLLQAKLEQAKLAAKVMNVATPGSYSAPAAVLKPKGSKTQTELREMQRSITSLAESTSKAISALSARVNQHPSLSKKHSSYLDKLKQLKGSTDKEMRSILHKIDTIAHK